MTSPESKEKEPAIIYVITLLLPFIIFYWMVPFITGSSLGMDYQTSSIENQMELLFSIKTGTFPLYVPGYALGHSSSALTLGEVFHPLPHVASIMPGYWEGKALQWCTFLRLLSLGLTQIVLFRFLRKLRISMLFSFLISCITVYNLRMLDLFRYGASLEAYTAHLLLCAAIGFYYISSSNPGQSGQDRPAPRWTGPLSIIGSTYLLVCSGHPQMMYYGLLGAGLFLLVAPFFISSLLPETHVTFKDTLRFWVGTASFLILGVLLSSAYVVPFYFDFIASNAERAGQSYAWADSYGDTLVGTLNSFFLPFRSDVHGNFGGSSLIIMAALLPALKLFRVKIPRSIWTIWGLIFLIFLHMQGARTPVHQLVWEYLPFASSFRIAGRVSLIMPVFIMMVLAWITTVKPIPVSLRGRSFMVSPFNLGALAAFITMGLYVLLFIGSVLTKSSIMTGTGHFTPIVIHGISRHFELFTLVSGLATVLTAFFYGVPGRNNRILGILLCMMMIIQITGVLKFGTWKAERKDQPSFEQMKAEKKEILEYRFYPGTGMYSSIVNRQLEQSFMEPYLGRIFNHVVPVSNIDDAYAEMQKGRTPVQVFVEGYKLKDNYSDTSQQTNLEGSTVELLYSSFNMLRFNVDSAGPAIFGMSYPFTGYWKALINGEESHVYRANGSAHAIDIPAGKNIIEFRYSSPASFWGVAISCAILALIGFSISLIALKGPARALAAVLSLIIGAAMFMLYQQSLYSGNNLGTEYTWTYESPSHRPNLAYGKKTWMRPPFRGSPGYLNNSRAVDGERARNRGFRSGAHDNSAWFIDLHRIEEVSSIDLYESAQGPSINKRPLQIAMSDDGGKWEIVHTLTQKPGRGTPLRVTFEIPESARYIRIQPNGFSGLSFDEIEVYGPEKAK